MPAAIFAHRLGRSYGPGSSRQALRRCLERPLDGVETDCCPTADGELVLLHDPLLALATTVSGWAHERTAAQILVGRLRDRDGRPSEERPMLLDELLELAPPDATLQLEIKAHGDPALAMRTARAVCERLADHPSPGARRGPQLLVGRLRAGRRRGVPLAAGDDRRLPNRRAHRVG